MAYRDLIAGFTGGVASDDVLARVDLDRYRTYLRDAQNCVVKPYGGVYKRNGSLRIATTYDNYAARQIVFRQPDVDYMLEFTPEWLVVRRAGVFVTAMETQFTAADIAALKHIKSADTLFLVCGRLPIQMIKKNGETWSISEFEIEIPPFMELDESGTVLTPSDIIDEIQIAASKNFFAASMLGDRIKMFQKVATKIEQSTSGTTSSTYSKTVYLDSNISLLITGSWVGTITLQRADADWVDVQTFNANGAYAIAAYEASYRLKFSVSTGLATAKLNDSRSSITASYQASDTNMIYVGDSWNILTTGSWTGTVTLMRSKDGQAFEDYKIYSSLNNDYNADQSGVVDTNDGYYYKVRYGVTSGTAKATLTSFGYTNEGIVKITGVIDTQNATATVIRQLAAAEAVTDFALPEFSAANGYPKCIEFFKDRFVLAATNKKPNGFWISKSGDYVNFDEQIEDGKITDDSAINTSIIARNDYNIKNVVTGKDLCIFTGEDERILSGDSAFTPTNLNIKPQTSWGSSEGLMPFVAGNRILYIQNNESYVRDFAYSYEADSYTGEELTLLIHHLLDGKKIVDYAYIKYPDSLIYFVLDDGTILCLTYLLEQKVFAWTRMVTQGEYVNVESAKENGQEVLYLVVKRDGTYYIEKQAADNYSEDPADYCMLDSAEVFTNSTGQGIVIPRFANKNIVVITTGSVYKVSNQTAGPAGEISVEENSEGTYENITIGLNYKMSITVPEVHTVISKIGSTIGRKKSIASIAVRMYKSFGGYAHTGQESKATPIFSTEEIGMSILDENLGVKLLSGVREIPLESESNDTGEVSIISEEPYPLKILSLARDVTL